MKAHTIAPTLPQRAPQLVFRIAVAVFLLAASFQSAWAQVAPSLHSAKSFAVLGGSTVTNTGPSTIHGDLGVSPGSAVTGFPPGLIVAPGALHAADAVALNAQNDVTIAYDSLKSQPCTRNLTGQDLAGKLLTAGVNCYSSSAGLSGSLRLDAKGNPNAVFIFLIESTLTTASNSDVRLLNGAQPCNVFWQVGSSATLGTNTSFIGNILALASITLTTGVSLNGRALARTAAVTLDTNNILFSGCSAGTTSGADTGTILPAPGDDGTADTAPIAGPGPICIDIRVPKVLFVGENSGPPTQWMISIQDTGSGIASIVVNVATNITTSIPAFTPGTTGVIIVTATKIEEETATFGVQVIDVCGNMTIWDPVDFKITASETRTLTGIPGIEHYVTIKNEDLAALTITVNGTFDRTVQLKPNTTRTINIRGAVVPGNNNTLTFEAFGNEYSKAVIFVHPK